MKPIEKLHYKANWSDGNNDGIHKINEIIDALTSQEECVCATPAPDCRLCNGTGKKESVPVEKFDVTSMDARVWAKEFMRIKKEHHDKWIDEALMIGWFANTIMAGYDEARRRYKPKPDKPVEKCTGHMGTFAVENGICQICGKESPDTPSEKDGLSNLILFHLQSGGWNLMSTYINSGDVADLAQAIHKYISDKLDGKKKNTCDAPFQDENGEVTSRCGGCFPCIYDQTIEEIHKALGLTGGKE